MNYTPGHRKEGLLSRLGSALHHQAITQKMNTPLGYTVFGLIAAVLAFAVAKVHFVLGIVAIAGFIGVTVATICMLNTKLGFFISIFVSFFIFFVNRMVQDRLPVGLAVDLLIAVTFLGIYFQKTLQKERYWQFSRNPITYIYFLYLGFLVVQLFNPYMFSIAGWIFSFRKFLNFVMIYFIALHVINSLEDVRSYFKVWLGLAVITALYGIFQHFFGLLGFEHQWLYSDIGRIKLYVQAGVLRNFSFLSDPTAFGITMAFSLVFAIVLAAGSVSNKQRIILLATAVLLALGLGYSGTRTAYAMVPVGLVLYILMTITSRKTLAFAIMGAITFIVIMFGPFYNSTIQRVRSAFEFSDDGSFNVREENRHYIQPYILSHPIGGGVSTSGLLGEQYNPGHSLAGFPPDSGYLKNAIETGWIGLALNCLVYFVVMQTSISGYYRSRNPEIRSYYAAAIASLYSMIVAHYAQVAIGQLPGAFFFYVLLAVVVKLKTFEQQQNSVNK